MIAHAEADGGSASGGNFALQGVWNNNLIDTADTIGPGDENVTLAFVVEMLGVKIEMPGAVGELDEFEDVALHVRVAGEKQPDLNVIAWSLPSVGPHALQADLRDGEDGIYILENLKAQIAESNLVGGLDFSSGERPSLTADLNSILLGLDVLLANNKGAPAAGTDAGAAAAAGEEGAPSGDAGPKRVFPEEPLNFAALDEADARVALKILEQRYRGLSLRNAELDLEQGVLHIEPVPGGEGDAAQLNCFVARFDVKDGVALNKALLFDTALTTTAGKGQICLGRELADLTVVPRPKDLSLLSLAIPVVIDRPLLGLSYNLKKEEVLLGLAGTMLGTALMGQFGILTPLVSAGSGDKNPCLTALEQPVQNEQRVTETPVKPAAPAEVVEELLDDVLGILD